MARLCNEAPTVTRKQPPGRPSSRCRTGHAPMSLACLRSTTEKKPGLSLSNWPDQLLLVPFSSLSVNTLTLQVSSAACVLGCVWSRRAAGTWEWHAARRSWRRRIWDAWGQAATVSLGWKRAVDGCRDAHATMLAWVCRACKKANSASLQAPLDPSACAQSAGNRGSPAPTKCRARQSQHQECSEGGSGPHVARLALLDAIVFRMRGSRWLWLPEPGFVAAWRGVSVTRGYFCLFACACGQVPGPEWPHNTTPS